LWRAAQQQKWFFGAQYPDYVLSGDTEKLALSTQDFLAPRKDVDPDIPIP
jgi:hypothetical protein